MDIRPLKVSEVNNYIKRVFLSDMILSNISVEGEVSNFIHHYSGHMYFNLKDEKGKIKSIMFKGDNEKLKFNVEEGMKIIATGYVSVYEKEGNYQLYVRHMKESGLGDLYKAFEDLKKKLELEGLFSDSMKKPIPFMPKKIGVVTSATGAAIKDIITVINRRFPPCNILIYPALVQGVKAPEEIIKGLLLLDNREDIDLIIVGRGGGSIEELFAFNDEELARTIYGLKTPIISAVGHETDFTITDFVSDLRAPTPSAAAELAVPDINHINHQLNNNYNTLTKAIGKKIGQHRTNIQYISRSLSFYSPLIQLKDKKQEIDIILRDIDYNLEKRLTERKTRLLNIKNRLDLLNPVIGLEKGFGILKDRQGKIIKSIEDIELGSDIHIVLSDGNIKALVKEKNKGGVIGG